MVAYDFREIEKKWQNKWFENKAFKAIDFHPTKPKYYILYEFYNISGNLHMGHLKGTVPADALARYKRFKGYNVLFPIGGDAFGLPAENAAIKKKINPHKFVSDGMNTVIEQSKMIGLSFDWDRTICTSDPNYYKWTQWIFRQLLVHDKAYKKKGFVNFCPNCNTVLSNEDSQGGKCDRCGGDVVQEERWVWFLKMKEYSEKLLDNVDHINMREYLKEQQRNWIGRSEGVELHLDLYSNDNNKIDTIRVFTTCIETVYGMTFVVLAPENKLINKIQNLIQNLDEIEDYKKQTSLRTELDRIANQKDKTGCKVEGIYAINPVNGNRVEVYLSDFVLASYGTGAVMAVPTHDQRDYEFAQKFNIPMIQVIEGDCSTCAVEKGEYIPANRKLLNSEEFSGLPVKDAKEKITEKVVSMGIGNVQVNYKMQDWSFNRQRYWGEPFPVMYCENCGYVPLEEDELPLVLPETEDYFPNDKGDSPLSKITDWVNCKCPKCGGSAKRETDTMPNWAGSSWYWLRYVDPHNNDALADYEKLKYWGSVDCYTGGTEHITRHVLYSFFWQNFLYEIGAVPSKYPFIRKMGSGLILDDTGKKMSKSSANGVSPVEVIGKYGADAARLHVHFLGGYEDDTPWTFDGINGVTSFIQKVWNLPDVLKGDEVSRKHIYDLNRLLKKASENYEDLQLNTIIAGCMGFIKKVKEDGYITKEELRQFLIILNPMAPFVTSELFEMVFGRDILDEVWPEYDEKYLQEDEIEIPIQIKGKFVRTIKTNKDIEKDELVELILKEYASIFKEETDFKKIIYIPGKIINFII
ncbi:MAG: leucine--tRNA ligase [Lachnospiraceae bacterium]|nr:leucine--tRNA ligase [Lachnospiraceae bacterium]